MLLPGARPTLDFCFPPQGRYPVGVNLLEKKLDGAPRSSVGPAVAGVVLLKAAVWFRGDTGIKGAVGTSKTIDKPHLS